MQTRSGLLALSAGTPGLRALVLAGVLIPFAGLVAAVGLLWLQGGRAFSWVYPALLVGMFVPTAVGITVGYHRLFTHRAFQTPRPVAFVLAVLGSMAVEGSVLKWVAIHRRHHQHSDEPGDPHSPHTMPGHRAGGVWATVCGLWHAHTGWLFLPDPPEPELARYTMDLRRDRMIRVVSRLFPLWVVLGLLIPAALGGLLTGEWLGVLLGFIWGGLVRIFFVHHMTWSINSVCHLWGSRPFRCGPGGGDESRNNVVFGVLGFGEGWHNNHHAFPTSARHGLRWWQIDAGYMVIRALAMVGLARNIRVPAPERRQAKRR